MTARVFKITARVATKMAVLQKNCKWDKEEITDLLVLLGLHKVQPTVNAKGVRGTVEPPPENTVDWPVDNDVYNLVYDIAKEAGMNPHSLWNSMAEHVFPTLLTLQSPTLSAGGYYTNLLKRLAMGRKAAKAALKNPQEAC